MRHLFFPDPPRDFPFRRAFRICTRTAHQLTSGVLLGGCIFGSSREQLHVWVLASLVTGLVLLATDLHASFAMLFQVRGVMVVAKLVLVGLVEVFWEARVALLVVAGIIGGIGSHMPGAQRYRVLLLDVRGDRRKG